MSALDVTNAAYAAGFRGQPLVTAIAVALAESRGDPNAHNTSGEDSRGLWQINVGLGAHPEYEQYNLFDPYVNAQVAYTISDEGSDWTPWTTYTGGAYLSYIPTAQQMAANVGGTTLPGSPSSIPTFATVPGLPPTINLFGRSVQTPLAILGGIAAILVLAD